MKTHSLLTLIVITGTFLFATSSPSVAGNGTDVFHYSTKAQMSVESGPSGKVDIKVREQGKASKESMVIRLRGLDADTPYEVQFMVLNPVDPHLDNVPAGDPIAFTSDSKGRAYLQSRNGNGSSNGKRTSISLPEELTYMEVTGVAIQDPAAPDSGPIMQADLGSAGKFHYLSKKNIKQGNVSGTLRIMSNQEQGQFRLVLLGLVPDSIFELGANSEIIQEVQTDGEGRLIVTAPLENALDVLGLESIRIADGAEDVVVVPLP